VSTWVWRVVILTLWTWASWAAAVTATGKAPIVNGDLVGARKTAVDEARRRAVEETVGVLVNSQIRSEYEVVVQSSILTESSGFITNEVITEDRYDDLFYYISISCDVSAGDVAAEIDKKKLAIAVQVEENILGQDVPPEERTIEGKVTQALVGARHLCVSPGVFSSAGNWPGVPANDVPTADANALGRRYMARVVVSGTVTVKVIGQVPDKPLPNGENNPLAGVDIVEAVANIAAVDTDTGKVFARFTSSPQQFKGMGFQPGMAASFAMKAAADGIPPFFVDNLAYLNQYPEREVTVTFDDVPNVDAVAQLKRTLVSQWFVVKCCGEEYRGRRATFKVLYAGDLMVLAVGLSHAVNPALNLTHAASDALVFEVQY